MKGNKNKIIKCKIPSFDRLSFPTLGMLISKKLKKQRIRVRADNKMNMRLEYNHPKLQKMNSEKIYHSNNQLMEFPLPFVDEFHIDNDIFDKLSLGNAQQIPSSKMIELVFSQNPFEIITDTEKEDIGNFDIPTQCCRTINKEVENGKVFKMIWNEVDIVMDEIILDKYEEEFINPPFQQKVEVQEYCHFDGLKIGVSPYHYQLVNEEKSFINEKINYIKDNQLFEIEEVLFDPILENEIVKEIQIETKMIIENEEGWERIKKDGKKWMEKWKEKKDIIWKMKNNNNLQLPNVKIKNPTLLFPFITKKFFIEEYNLRIFDINTASFKEKFGRIALLKMVELKEPKRDYKIIGNEEKVKEKVKITMANDDFEIEEEDNKEETSSIDSNEIQEILNEMQSITSKINKQIEEKRKEEIPQKNQIIQIKNPKEEIEKAEKLIKETRFNIPYSQELKEMFEKRKTVIQNKGKSKFKKRINKEENKKNELSYIKPIEIKSKIREKLMNKVDQYFNLTNENIFQMNEIDQCFPWNKKHKEVIIPSNVMSNIKKIIYLTDSNDFVQSYKTMTTENRKKRNLLLSPCYLISFIATEINSLIQIQPNAKFLICCEPIFFDYIQLLITYYLENDANCSFGIIKSDETKENNNNNMVSFINLKDVRDDIIKRYNQVFYINKLSDHGICFNYIDKINQEEITKQKNSIRKGFKPIASHIINTESCPVKEKLLKLLIETNQPNELITKLVQTDDIGSIIDKLSQQEFNEIKKNYENGIIINNQIEEIINHWIETRNTKLFDFISFNPLIQTKEIKEIKWNLITELLVIFPNDLLTISLIGELCLTNKITLTIIINSLQKIPSIGSMALSNELLRKHIKNIDTLQVKLKEIKSHQIYFVHQIN
ncbi:hypothetical protein, conserved [Entamoeba dispar SAW760]|uniref:Uncharacterized protein n=1 Tax=Entamoeba dispar (strain ATCC PRA-260 / SAW760) TaxID=370354 RepID=B0EU06_ENTDS|nr:uncharacterized protein EDI_020490 [Entamoeba dispar SAW760]EDR21975.1 hypothetical protein, conserved [Entamoeba dispar SAW760]|eukprot:EDR21975.1 hypothetical protein, conserved [Entamoeba dispar SAW760]